MLRKRRTGNTDSRINETPLFWPATLDKGILWVLDETLIPNKMKYIKVTNAREAIKVIREMKTRAFGQLLVVLYTFLIEFEYSRESSPKLVLEKTIKISKTN